MPSPRIADVAVAVLFTIFVVASGTGATAQALPPDAGRATNWMDFTQFFVPECPQGCRDVDAYVTCGAVDQAAACTMTQRGDVIMTCVDASEWRLTSAVNPCSRGVNQTQLGSQLREHFGLRVMYRLTGNFGRLFDAVRVPGFGKGNAMLSVVELAIVFVATCLPPFHLRGARLIPGFFGGLVMGMLPFAIANVAFGPWYTYTVVFAVAVPAVCGLCFRFNRVSLVVCGALIGVALACAVAFQAFLRVAGVVPAWYFYAAVALVLVCGYLGTISPRRTRAIFFTTLAAACLATALMQLIGPLVNGGRCTSLSALPHRCGYAVHEVTFAASFVLCAMVHVTALRRAAARAALMGGDDKAAPLRDDDREMTQNFYGAV